MTPRADLTAPGGTASSAANATVSTYQRAPSSSPAASASVTAVPVIVRCVPANGMNTMAAVNVPRMLPIVESPYSRPDTAPAFSTDGSARRIANGLTVPSSVTGTAKSASAAKNEPTAAPRDAVSSSRTVASSTGRKSSNRASEGHAASGRATCRSRARRRTTAPRARRAIR